MFYKINLGYGYKNKFMTLLNRKTIIYFSYFYKIINENDLLKTPHESIVPKAFRKH